MQRPEPSGADAAPSPTPSGPGAFRALFHNRLAGVDLVDGDGRWVDVNERLCELLATGRDRLVGRAVEDFTHPDDAAAEREHVRRLSSGGASSYRMTKRLLRGDGRWLRVEVDAAAVELAPGTPGRASVVVPVGGEEGPFEADRRLRALMEESPWPVVLIDPATGAFLEFNEAASEALGFPGRELAGMTLAELEVEETRGEIPSRLDYIVEAGGARFEVRLRRRDGGVATVAVSARRVEHRGRPAVQSICRLLPTEGEADGRDSLVRQVLHGAPLPMGIVELSDDGLDVLHVFDNPAACRSLGLDPGGTAGRRDGADLGVPPGALKAWIEAYRASRRVGHAVQFEEAHEHEGGRRWLGVVVSHVGRGPSGRDRFCYIAEDITDRKRDEEEIRRLNRSLERQAAELRTVFEVLPIGIGIADDPECRLIRGNPAFSRMLRIPAGSNVSLTAPEAERPATFRVFRDGRELAELELPMQSTARTGVPVRDFEAEVRFDDGESAHLLEYVAPLFDEAGAVRGCVGAFLDVTERRRAEEERERLLQGLRDADRRKDAFLAMLAHELRSPLSATGNAAQILQMKAPDDPDVRWCCDVIRRQTGRLSRLMDDLLDVSRIGRGKLVLRREAVDLRGVVEREAKRHRLDVSLPGEPIGVTVDPARIEQVVVNLLSNAAKYSEEGRTIAISARRDGPTAVVRVEDEGVGMTPEVLARIFDPFTQAEATIGRSQGGLGIGLAIAKSLVEMHGGGVAAESDGPGLGSAFTVRLPLSGPIASGPEAPEPTPPPAATARRVLVVDDNSDAALSLGRLLEGAGHHVATALDGPSALEIAAEFRPEAAVLDLGLPGMDGFELASRLRRTPGGRAMLLVALTGYGREDDRRRARRAGFDHHMMKPADVVALARLLAGPPPP